MSSLWFVVPAYGRVELARICLRQLRLTCDQLTAEGVDASAVVVADDENLDTARTLGFATVQRDNDHLGRKFNDGIQLACDEKFNPRPADYVVPCGSDDWIDARILLPLPPAHTVVGFKNLVFVREDGREMRASYADYPGGCGMRIYPRQIVATLGYRPADEDRQRGCDTSILMNLRGALAPRTMRVEHRETDPRSIVDWKSTSQQINSYEGVTRIWGRRDKTDPFEALRAFFGLPALREMARYYRRPLPTRSRAKVADAVFGSTIDELAAVGPRPMRKAHPAVYEVTGHRRVRGYGRGETFEAQLDRSAELRAISRGDIRVVARFVPSLQPGTYSLPDGWLNQKEEVH